MNRRVAVTGCTADFTIGTRALLSGLARHHPDVQRICFAPPRQVQAVQADLGTLAEVRAIPRRLKHAPDEEKILVSWSRVFIPTIEADAVAWFDSDVIVCRPAPEWWQIAPGRVHAVADRAYRIRHMVPLGMEAWYFNRFHLRPDLPGFNAGVFALRPADHPNLAEQFEELLAEQDPNVQPFAFDQGLLNGLLRERADLLPPEFNAHCLAECGVPRNVRVIHYTGSPKPWSPEFSRWANGYCEWLRHGAGESNEAVLAAARARNLAMKPIATARKAVRKAAGMLGFWREEKGVGRRPGSGSNRPTA